MNFKEKDLKEAFYMKNSQTLSKLKDLLRKVRILYLIGKHYSTERLMNDNLQLIVDQELSKYDGLLQKTNQGFLKKQDFSTASLYYTEPVCMTIPAVTHRTDLKVSAEIVKDGQLAGHLAIQVPEALDKLINHIKMTAEETCSVIKCRHMIEYTTFLDFNTFEVKIYFCCRVAYVPKDMAAYNYVERN